MTVPPVRAGRKEWTAFTVLLLPLLLVAMDVSVLYFAIPAITADLAPTNTQQLWIFDIYGFVLSGLLMTMGSLADRFGGRKVLLVGATVFGLASAAAAYAQSAEMLILARAVLGIGGATLMPSTMALVRHMFHDPKQRSAAIGIWSGTMAGGVALGSVMSGFLIEHFWWGSVFLVNIPAMLMLVFLTPLLVPEFRNPDPGPFDLTSTLLSLCAVLPVINGIQTMSREGFEPFSATGLVIGLAFGVVFVRRQFSHPHALINPRLFQARGFGAGLGLNAIAFFSMMGANYFTTQYLQSVLGMSPFTSALWSIVPSVAVGIAAPLATTLAQAVNRAYVVSVGFVLAAAGYAVLYQAEKESSLWIIMTATVILAIGTVAVMAVATDMALSTVPKERAGSAASLLETAQQFSGALGLAVLGSIGAAVYHTTVRDTLPDGLPQNVASAAEETLGGASVAAAELPGQTGEMLLAVARDAFTTGMHVVAIVAGATLLVGSVISVITLRNLRIDASTDTPGQPAEEAVSHQS